MGCKMRKRGGVRGTPKWDDATTPVTGWWIKWNKPYKVTNLEANLVDSNGKFHFESIILYVSLVLV